MTHQLPYNQLIELLHSEIAKDKVGSIAVLIVQTKLVNRIDALTGVFSMLDITRHIEHCLDKFLRTDDRFAYFSGEQICLVLPNLLSKNQSVLAAIKIISELKNVFFIDSCKVLLKSQVGVANFSEPGQTADQLLGYADLALRNAIQDDKEYHSYVPKKNDQTHSYRGLDFELESAIKANEIGVHFQPQIDVRSGRCFSAEALVRWKASGECNINPGVLISLAESNGLLIPLTLLILNTALRNCASFAAVGANIGISVNLPPVMLEEEDLPIIIQQALDTWNVAASKLTLEITEGSNVNKETSLIMLSRLREMGLKIAIDDFGTGYSSLAYIKKLPANELKIDIHFVRNIHNSQGDKQLVRAIIDLAHIFDMVTVAEGVEDKKTYDLLCHLGCDAVQGFYFSNALSEQDFIAWLIQHG
jgi:EAL domain-containing protein (putative c-di-GMP-specific phosphodiesterase class I)